MPQKISNYLKKIYQKINVDCILPIRKDIFHVLPQISWNAFFAILDAKSRWNCPIQYCFKIMDWYTSAQMTIFYFLMCSLSRAQFWMWYKKLINIKHHKPNVATNHIQVILMAPSFEPPSTAYLHLCTPLLVGPASGDIGGLSLCLQICGLHLELLSFEWPTLCFLQERLKSLILR